VNSVRYGMKVGFAIWLGFVTTIQLTTALFEKKPTKRYLINTGYQLVCYAVMGSHPGGLAIAVETGFDPLLRGSETRAHTPMLQTTR